MDTFKQPTLRPQDLVVAIQFALNVGGQPSFAQLGRILHLSASEAHASVQRCLLSRLLRHEDGELRANQSSLFEFLVHGAPYAFPAVEGPMVRGMLTGVSASPFDEHFARVGTVPLVWPDANGDQRGRAIFPLYAKVPEACRGDAGLYRVLAVFDALRGGAAREREMATGYLKSVLL